MEIFSSNLSIVMHEFCSMGTEVFECSLLLWVLGFTQERIQIQANIQFKVKVSLLMKQRDREWDSPQTEQPPLVGFAFFIEVYVIRG